MIFLQLGQLGSLLDGIVQRTNGVNQFDAKRIVTQPNTSLGNLLNLVNRLLATIGHALAEQFVATTDILVEQSQFLGIERTGHRAKGSVLVGLDLVELHAQLVCQQSAEIGEHAEDTNRTCDGSGLRVNVVGSTTDIVATAGSVATHRYDYRLLGFHLSDATPDLF